MANLMKWGRPSMLGLQRDIDDLLEDFSSPRAFRREIERLFDEHTSMLSLSREMERLMDEYESPPTLRSRISRLFDSVRGKLQGKTEFVPSVELVEQDKDYVLKADLPGIREQDVDISIDQDNVLTIRGERREEKTKTVRGYEYSERAYGSFMRSISLPMGIDSNKIEADFRNGVLEIHIPKTATTTTTRKIPISKEEPKVVQGGNGPTVHRHS